MKDHGLKNQARLLPGYILLGIWVLFTFILIGWIIAASFSTTKEIYSGNVLKFATGLHLENYVRAWEAQNVSVFFTNSLIYAPIATVLVLIIAAPAAYVLSRLNFKINKLVQQCFVVGMSVPLVMIILPLFSSVSRLGLLKQDWTIRLVVIFLNVGVKVPYTTIFLLSFFKTISTCYEEAAIIDGCTRSKAFWKIMLPLAQPGVITVSIFNFIGIWNEYFISLIFANAQNVKPVAVGLYSMISSMKYTGDWAGLFASVVIVFLPTLIVYLFLANRILEGVTQGGTKG